MATNQPIPPAATKMLAVFAAIGGVILIVGLALAVNTALFISRAVVTDATVVEVSTSWHEGDPMFQPTFEFDTPDGTVLGGPTAASSEWDYELGEQVEVRYDPDDPERAIPTDAFSTWIIPGVVAVMGLGFTAIPVVLLVVFRAVAKRAA